MWQECINFAGLKTKTGSWIILIALSLVWGSSFILMKRGMDAFSSDEVAALRIGIAFLVLAPFHLRYWKIKLKNYLPGILLMGIFGNLIPAFLFTLAETQISSSLTGMLNALTPVFTLLIGFIWLRVRPSSRQLVGILVGFVSAVCLALFETANDTFRNAAYSGLVLVATLCYALSINAIRKYLGGLHPVAATVWAFTFTGPLALAYLFGGTHFVQHLSNNTQALPALGYVALLAVVGTALSVIVYNVLIRQAGVVFASSCTYLIPVVALGWGLADGETVNGPQLLAMAAVILSVYLLNRR